jgi:hypothetical protein
MQTQQLFSAITDAWTVVIVVYSVLRSDDNDVWVIGGLSDNAITKACLLHTILFLSVLTTQVRRCTLCHCMHTSTTIFA